MSSRCRNLRRVALGAAAVLVLMGNHQAGAAPTSARVCIDTNSPAADLNRKVAEAAAQQAGWSLDVVATPWNKPGDDDGLSAKDFRAMADTSCDLVMGFPMDAKTTTAPAGLNRTGAYIHTGFVLVGHASVPSWKDLPAKTTVGVTYNSPAALLLAKRGGVSPQVFGTEAETLSAVQAGKVPYGLVWEMSVDGAGKDGGGLTVRRLGLPQADWVLVALYADRAKTFGKAFDQALGQLRHNGQLAALTGPAKPAAGPRLFSVAQAEHGAKVFAANCAACHGAHLEGHVGPALRGSGFAGPDDGYTVGAMFTFLSTQMPAGAPGSLKQDQYAALMAYILKENGYPADGHTLTYADAQSSTVPLVSRIGAPATPPQASADVR